MVEFCAKSGIVVLFRRGGMLMSTVSSKLAVSKMSTKERELRSHLVRLSSRYGFMRATLNERERSCGKSNCRCARGEKHRALYLVSRKGGELRQVFVPQSRETEARQLVEQYQKMQNLLDEISEFYWDKIQSRED